MKTLILLTICVLFSSQLYSQTPKIYINLGTHNEMQGEFYDTDETEYNNAVLVIDQILNHVNSLGAKWNFQTCSKFVLGALNWDNAFTSSSDVLERMYLSGNVEIDPRNKTLMGYNYNISDVYHLLDSCGVTSTHTVGGFLCYPYANEDWTQFRLPKLGAVYNQPWQADIIWGGGSPNHVQDANNYGVWKPKSGDSDANFYTHDPTKNLWLVGNGCAPVISDTTTDVQWIVNLIRDNVEKVKSGVWPSNKFYSMTFMINVRDMDLPGYYTKVRTVLDSIQTYVNAGDMEWATISEKLALFESWSSTNNIPSSQWTCEEALAEGTSSIREIESQELHVYPNPVSDVIFLSNLTENVSYQIYNTQGKMVNFGEYNQTNKSGISVEHLIPGIYFVSIDGADINKKFKIIKQ